MEPLRLSIDDSLTISMYDDILLGSRVLSIPLIRCDDQVFNKVIKQENIDEIDHSIDDNILQIGNPLKTEREDITDIKIKTESDELYGSVLIENHSLELINHLNSDQRFNLREKTKTVNVCSKSNLTTHMKIHTSEREKPFICALCNKSYYKKSDLKMHILHHTHENFKNRILYYSCDVCGKRFVFASSLNKHSRTHTEETDYSNDDQLFKIGSTCKTEREDITDLKIKTEIDLIEGFEFEGMLYNKNQSLEFINRLNLDKRSNLREKSVKFNVCSSAFSNSPKFPVNKKFKSGNNHHKCDICDKLFNFKSNLTRHLKIHTSKSEVQFICAMCNKSYYRKLDLKIHILRRACKNTSINRSFNCDLFDKRFSQEEHVTNHMRLHTKKRPHICNICNKEFSNASSLKKHSMIHTGEKPYICDICNEGFSQSGNLKVHRRIHTGEKPYHCDICKKMFSQAEHLKNHRRTHTLEKPYKCKACDKSFSLFERLKQHTRTHTGEKPYRCDVCDKSFASTTNLKVHRRIHTGEKPYKCPICPKRFYQSSDSKKHSMMHSDIKPYKCHICNKGFTLPIYVKIHTRIHNRERPFKCELCDKMFSFSDRLKKHRMTHTGEKPFRCDICNKYFSVASNLKVHKRIHTGEKPYKCDVCGKAFYQTPDLKRHLRTHTNEKPYKCHICNKEFTQAGNLNMHTARKHPVEKI